MEAVYSMPDTTAAENHLGTRSMPADPLHPLIVRLTGKYEVPPPLEEAAKNCRLAKPVAETS
jgi:hypothetical protein